jgi:RNA polymerase sigma factor (TIGR02999 family)
MSGKKHYNKQALTELLQASRAGDKEAVNKLLPFVYDEMRHIAHHKLKFERQGHTLDTTALVHEAYLKLIDHEKVEWQSRTHFLGVAALAMKRILIDYAERRNAVKRGKEYSRVEVDDIKDPGSMIMTDSMADEIIAMCEALNRMKEFNERGGLVVDYHFFGGLTWNEISEVMGIAPVTVRRAWNASQLWLKREIKELNINGLSSDKAP